jgi:hypothetical protein
MPLRTRLWTFNSFKVLLVLSLTRMTISFRRRAMPHRYVRLDIIRFLNASNHLSAQWCDNIGHTWCYQFSFWAGHSRVLLEFGQTPLVEVEWNYAESFAVIFRAAMYVILKWCLITWDCVLYGARGSVVVKGLCYKPEGHGFDSWWGEFWNLPNPSGRTRPWGLLSL